VKSYLQSHLEIVFSWDVSSFLHGISKVSSRKSYLIWWTEKITCYELRCSAMHNSQITMGMFGRFMMPARTAFWSLQGCVTSRTLLWTNLTLTYFLPQLCRKLTKIGQVILLILYFSVIIFRQIKMIFYFLNNDRICENWRVSIDFFLRIVLTDVKML
jgi:hypothetical protein